MSDKTSHSFQKWQQQLGPAAGPLLRPAEAAEYLGISVSGFYQQIKEGNLPPLVKIGPRAAGMSRPWLDRLIERRLAGKL